MCGRYASARKRIELLEEFSVERDRVTEPLEPDYNVAPTKPVYAVLTRAPRAGQAAGPPAAGMAGPPAAGMAGPPADGAAGEPADSAPRRELRVVRWGLVPSWAKDVSIGSRLINARAETVSQKPAFKRAFARRRCLLPADGYYEWQVPAVVPGAAQPGTVQPEAVQPEGAGPGPARGARAQGGRAAPDGVQPDGVLPGAGRPGKARSGPAKQPFYISRRDGGPLAFAGLYELWRDSALPDGDPDAWLWTATVITTSAPDDLGRIHDRMPMVIERDSWADWLDPASGDAEALLALLAPAAANGLASYPVSRAVNSVRNNGPELIEPVDLTEPELQALGLTGQGDAGQGGAAPGGGGQGLTGAQLGALGRRPSGGGPDTLF